MTTLPTIHLNGTGRETLLAEYHAAYRAVLAARDAFHATTCNGRDFYPQGPDAYSQARTERDAVLNHFGAIQQYLEAHLIHLAP
jgi:hypothetical protein